LSISPTLKSGDVPEDTCTSSPQKEDQSTPPLAVTRLSKIVEKELKEISQDSGTNNPGQFLGKPLSGVQNNEPEVITAKPDDQQLDKARFLVTQGTEVNKPSNTPKQVKGGSQVWSFVYRSSFLIVYSVAFRC
jgi:hypothetical protein